MIRVLFGLSTILFTLQVLSQVVHAQPSQVSISFEDLAELDTLGGVTVGTLEQVPGVSGNGLSLANATSLCFPAQTFLNEVQGTLQFWVKNLSANGGLWEISPLGTSQLWGAYRFSDPTTDVIRHEIQTAAATSARTFRNWTANSNWHFVVFTWSQGSIRTEVNIYLDAVAGAKPNLIGKITLTPTSTLCLGKYSNKGSSHPTIDELATFSYVRTATQITDDFWQYFTGCPSWTYIWRNPLNGADVNRDGVLDRYDTLHVLSAIASGDQFNFLACPNDQLPPFSYDVFADNLLNDLDAQSALTALNNTLPVDDRLTIGALRLLTHGDANEDGSLNLADIQIILQNQGTSVDIFTNGDITGDGLVDSKDLNVARKFISQEGELSATLPRFKVMRPPTTE